MKVILWVVFFVFSGLVQASDIGTKPTKQDYSYQHKFQITAGLGIQNGGDKVWELVWVDTGKTAEIVRAGGFWRGEIGAQIPLGQSPFSVQVDAGMLYYEGRSSIEINNDKANFRRTLVNVIPFFHFDRYRVGVGATQHFSIAFNDYDTASDQSMRIDYDDATGAVAQIDARYDQNIMVGFRYTYINYESSDADLDAIEAIGSAEAIAYARDMRELSGNAIGIHFIASF